MKLQVVLICILYTILAYSSIEQLAFAGATEVPDKYVQSKSAETKDEFNVKSEDGVAYSLEERIEQSLLNVKQEFDKFINSLSLTYRNPIDDADSADKDGDVEEDGSRHENDKLNGKHRGSHDSLDEKVVKKDTKDEEENAGGEQEEEEEKDDEDFIEEDDEDIAAGELNVPDKSEGDLAENVNEKAIDGKALMEVANNTTPLPAGGTGSDAVKECNGCDVGKESVLDYRIEKFKAELLQRLGLTEPPRVNGPIRQLPTEFYHGEKFSVNDEPEHERDEHKVKTREIFVFGKDVTDSCLNKKGAGCYTFNITNKGIRPEDVSSVDLWIYKQADRNDHHIQTFVVSELSKKMRKGKEYLQSRNIVQRIETRLKYGWMKIYVNRIVLRWLSKPHRNNGLAVVCKTCKWKGHKTIFGEKEGMMPFLVFYMNRGGGHRYRNKRETRCLEGGENCCHREPLEINFRDIGWDYIMAPPSIRPNYCTGSCNGVHAAYYNHTRLVQTLQQSVMHEFTPMQPCCSPVHFRRTQSLLYRDHRGDVRKIDIPDLIVGECGCT